MSKRMAVVSAAVVLGSVVIVYGDSVPAAAESLVPPGACAADLTNETGSLVPEDLSIPIPFPQLAPVPYPAPTTAPTRIDPEPLPADPCVDPCPELTDETREPTTLSSELNIPRIGFEFKPFTIPIPIPGPEVQLPPPPDPASPPVEPAVRTPAPPTPQIGNVTRVAKQTGAGSINRTDKRWQVYGTDLGMMWESAPGQIATAFGDSVGKGFHPPGGQGPDWRSNVLAFSTDTDLSDGVTYDSMVQDSRCHAAELLSSRKLDNVEITTIPTSGFALGDRQYMSYMSIRTWNSIPGTWWTNYGGIAYSDDGGSTWTKDPYAQWDNIFGVSKFQVTSMVPQGDYVYMFGTPNTRLGDVGVARVPKDQVLNKSAYQYWSEGNWTPVGGYTAASTIVAAPAAELSVRYDDARQRWQMTYLDTAKTAITLRESDSPQGAWSDGAPMVSVADYPELYGGFMHPWSTGTDLYFNISTWSDYNVFQMHAELTN
ncbi:carbohydrate-binding protein [Rhodococcus sp. 1163]|uniref:DUF4185 domain-containing protein n=1 Tax=Rhodococcus sp. 1163 TaxID=1905289 RepID=UPI000A06A544|nr:DUF4185 domain-containing protein [Rhodococcus sp. 1163]ORI18977.1 carbohydrate-binding protein [Rhodococcus sp. 1163]